MAKPVDLRSTGPGWCQTASDVDIERLPRKAEILRDSVANPTKDDCRNLVSKLREWQDNRLWVHVAESWEQFITETIDCSLEWVDLIFKGVDVLDNSAPISTDEALNAGRIVKRLEQKAAEAQPVAKPGRPPKIDRGKVLELREQGMSQRAIADRLGVSQQGVSNALTTNRDNVTFSGNEDPVPIEDRGNSQDYLLRRIADKAPELLDSIGKGKAHKSARSAAIAAGIIKPKKQITIGDDPAKIAAKLLDYDPDLAKAIARAILAE